MTQVNVTIDGRHFLVDVPGTSAKDEELSVICQGRVRRVAIPAATRIEALEWIMIDNRPYEVVIDPNLRWIRIYDGLHRIEVQDSSVSLARPTSGDGRVKAPIPGLVVQLCVEEGQKIEAGEPLLVLEAMKMENEILAPRSGIVAHVGVAPGQTVILHEVMVEIV
jgi:biotin carboxyl carrier protein